MEEQIDCKIGDGSESCRTRIIFKKTGIEITYDYVVTVQGCELF